MQSVKEFRCDKCGKLLGKIIDDIIEISKENEKPSITLKTDMNKSTKIFEIMCQAWNDGKRCKTINNIKI